MKRALMWQDPFLKVGSLVLCCVVALALIGPWLSPYAPFAHMYTPLSPPSASHWLGVNDAGMDIFTELVYALRNALVFGLWTAGLSVGIGAVVGITAGLKGGIVDAVLMRMSEIVLAIPSVIVLLLMASIYQPPLVALGWVLACLSFPVGAKILRYQTRRMKQNLYVQAAKQMGAGLGYIAWRHVAPTLYPLMFFAFIGRFKFAILAQVTLSFLGLIDPSEKSLGMMIRYGMEYYYLDVWWYWILPPVVLLALVLVALTFLIFSLEGVIDPRIKGVWRG